MIRFIDALSSTLFFFIKNLTSKKYEGYPIICMLVFMYSYGSARPPNSTQAFVVNDIMPRCHRSPL